MTLTNHGAPPLSPLRVIEMGQLLAGPFCGQLLADFGAEVIKLEEPGKGDPMRQWGREKPHGLSLWWPVVARNKKSVTVNLRDQRGQELAQRLIAQSDIVVENFRPGTLERWNLGYEELSKPNPGLIMARVTGFGQSGPYAGRPGFGAIGEGMGGLRYVVGEPGRPPSRVGISIGDSLAGTFATLGILIALEARRVTGRGQVVDSAIYEAVLALMESLIPEYAVANYVRERTGPILPNVSPSNAYPTSDGEYLLIAANHDLVFARLARAMGAPQLASDARFATHSSRGEHQRELDEMIMAWTGRQRIDELEAALTEAEVPFGRIYRAPDMLVDPHFSAREDIVHLSHPELGDFPMQNVAPRLSATPGRIQWIGPPLGAHTHEIYSALLGMTENELRSLQARGVI